MIPWRVWAPLTTWSLCYYTITVPFSWHGRSPLPSAAWNRLRLIAANCGNSGNRLLLSFRMARKCMLMSIWKIPLWRSISRSSKVWAKQRSILSWIWWITARSVKSDKTIILSARHSLIGSTGFLFALTCYNKENLLEKSSKSVTFSPEGVSI